MPRQLNVFTKRYLQITTAFMVFAAIEQYGHIPHSVWIILISSLVYSGFNPSVVLKRSYLRFFGTITGVAAVFILWHFIHFDYRLEIILVLLIFWAFIFFKNIPYNQYMIVSTLFSDLLIEWTNSASFSIEFYVIDRVICTAIIFGLCILMEYAWFGSSNMTTLQYHHSCCLLRRNLHEFYLLADSNRVTKARMFKAITSVNQQIASLCLLIDSLVYEHNKVPLLSKNAETVTATIVHIFRKIVCLYYLRVQNEYDPKIELIRAEIEQALSIPLEEYLR